jgi:hypothetical protein
MSPYSIQWSATFVETLETERYAQFVAFVQQGKLVFLDTVYRENLTTAISARLQKQSLDHLNLTIYLGRIREIGEGKIDSFKVNALHDLLVFALKPRLNSEGKYRYKGLPNLQMTNVGCELIPRKLRAENSFVMVGAYAPSFEANPVSVF